MSERCDTERSPSSRLASDERGSVQAEYTIVLVLVAIVAALAVGGLSWPLLQYHRSITDQVTSPVP